MPGRLKLTAMCPGLLGKESSKLFPSLEVAHTQNWDSFSAKVLYAALSPSTGLDRAQSLHSLSVNFEGCSSRREIICLMVLFCFPLML